MECALLLDVVVGKGSSVLELLTGEDKSLLIGRNTLFVLDLLLNVLDLVGALYVKSDSLSGKSLDEDLHTTSESKDQVKSAFLLDVIIGEGPSIFKLLTSEDESLLIRRNTFLVLDLLLDVLDLIGGLNIESNGLSCKCLYEDLHGLLLRSF